MSVSLQNHPWLQGQHGPVLAHVLCGLLTTLVLAGFVRIVNLPLYRQRAVAREELQQLEDVLSRDQPLLQQLQTMKQSLAEAEQRVAKISQRIPDARQESEILQQLSQVAEEHDLDIADYRRTAVKQHPQFSSFQIELQCQATYRSLCHVLDALHHSSRLANVTQLNVACNPDTKSPHQTRLTARNVNASVTGEHLAPARSARYPIRMTVEYYFRAH